MDGIFSASTASEAIRWRTALPTRKEEDGWLEMTTALEIFCRIFFVVKETRMISLVSVMRITKCLRSGRNIIFPETKGTFMAIGLISDLVAQIVGDQMALEATVMRWNEKNGLYSAITAHFSPPQRKYHVWQKESHTVSSAAAESCSEDFFSSEEEGEVVEAKEKGEAIFKNKPLISSSSPPLSKRKERLWNDIHLYQEVAPFESSGKEAEERGSQHFLTSSPQWSPYSSHGNQCQVEYNRSSPCPGKQPSNSARMQKVEHREDAGYCIRVSIAATDMGAKMAAHPFIAPPRQVVDAVMEKRGAGVTGAGGIVRKVVKWPKKIEEDRERGGNVVAKGEFWEPLMLQRPCQKDKNTVTGCVAVSMHKFVGGQGPRCLGEDYKTKLGSSMTVQWKRDGIPSWCGKNKKDSNIVTSYDSLWNQSEWKERGMNQMAKEIPSGTTINVMNKNESPVGTSKPHQQPQKTCQSYCNACSGKEAKIHKDAPSLDLHYDRANKNLFLPLPLSYCSPTTTLAPQNDDYNDKGNYYASFKKSSKNMNYRWDMTTKRQEKIQELQQQQKQQQEQQEKQQQKQKENYTWNWIKNTRAHMQDTEVWAGSGWGRRYQQTQQQQQEQVKKKQKLQYQQQLCHSSPSSFASPSWPRIQLSKDEKWTTAGNQCSTGFFTHKNSDVAAALHSSPLSLQLCATSSKMKKPQQQHCGNNNVIVEQHQEKSKHYLHKTMKRNMTEKPEDALKLSTLKTCFSSVAFAEEEEYHIYPKNLSSSRCTAEKLPQHVGRCHDDGISQRQQHQHRTRKEEEQPGRKDAAASMVILSGTSLDPLALHDRHVSNRNHNKNIVLRSFKKKINKGRGCRLPLAHFLGVEREVNIFEEEINSNSDSPIRLVKEDSPFDVTGRFLYRGKTGRKHDAHRISHKERGGLIKNDFFSLENCRPYCDEKMEGASRKENIEFNRDCHDAKEKCMTSSRKIVSVALSQKDSSVSIVNLNCFSCVGL